MFAYVNTVSQTLDWSMHIRYWVLYRFQQFIQLLRPRLIFRVLYYQKRKILLIVDVPESCRRRIFQSYAANDGSTASCVQRDRPKILNGEPKTLTLIH